MDQISNGTAALKQGWSKTWPIIPQDNIISHILLPKMRIFTPSYERDNCPVYMNLLLAWEYSRMWQKERDEFLKKRTKEEKPKFIKNNYEKWIAKRKVKAEKCDCKIAK